MDWKDVFKYAVAGSFVISLIVGFFMGLIPAEVFVGVAGGAITYVVSNKKHQNEIKALKSVNAKIIKLSSEKK